MWLDTDARRFDVARILRDARRLNASTLRWGETRVEIRDDGDSLVLAGRVSIALERRLVRLPSGELVAGPVVALCPRSGCERRARVLWQSPCDPDGAVACRSCVGLQYASASTSDEAKRAALAYAKARAQLGLVRPWETFLRAEGKHRAKFKRLEHQLEQARHRVATTKPRRPAWMRKKPTVGLDR